MLLVSQKRLVCCTTLAYHRLVKLLDRNTDASGVHARDDPDTHGVCAGAMQTAVDVLFLQAASAGTCFVPYYGERQVRPIEELKVTRGKAH
jgi:hypothetical protein